MRTVTVKQIRDLDKMAIEDFGVPSIALMENAGRVVAQEAVRQLKKKKRPVVVVVCGTGNNAGDGFVAARHLINTGIKTRIFLIGYAKDLRQDAAVNHGILKNIGYPVKEIGRLSGSFLNELKTADIVVDAVFGVGLNRTIREPFKGIIEAINRNAKKIISVDVPSGLDGTTGKIYGTCVKAHTTVTFSFLKKGFLINEGPRHTGRKVIVDIGIPECLKRKIITG